MLFPKKCSILFRIFLYFFLSFFILPWSSIRWWFAGCLLFPEIHDVLSFIYIEIAILADFFKGLYSYRIFIYYFCHIPTCFTFCAAKLRRNSELAKLILKIIRKRSPKTKLASSGIESSFGVLLNYIRCLMKLIYLRREFFLHQRYLL